ncbi:MAG TPA: hypothetical protein EYN18_08320 [Nitrospirales bacterium]|nr:hypothetical protein [Nitrospirales bacterium]
MRVVLCDEVDRYPQSAGAEGDPISLAQKRSDTFFNSVHVTTSTPTIKGVSGFLAAAAKSGWWSPRRPAL